ncbi:MAG: hypothetical protein L0Y66_17670 [Myxococcaceae bacterium]|nr:hypothetical protein [Myxococcaceae bacterium]MCI0670209.1 hypothetical protein [Myxococcaceae bacterium]
MTLSRSLRFGLLLGLTGAATALASTEVSDAPVTQAPAPVEVDEDGVGMLFPSNPSGSSFRLGTGDPTTVDPQHFDMEGDPATEGSENGLTFWSTAGHRVTYASGKPAGKTVRLHLRPSGGVQNFTWRFGAAEKGYIGNPGDVLNFEATVYVRVLEHNGTHNSMSWKLRGGTHTKPDIARSSCVGMDVPFGGVAPQAFRELDHPTYDHVQLTPKFPFQLQEGQWVGVKIVSYLVPGGTQNLLYVDANPFDANGTPRNDFRLFTEWMDQDGVSTGHYSTAATWAGWETTFRVDGWRRVDFALPSVREIIPPTSPVS